MDLTKSNAKNQSRSIFLIRERVPFAEALKPGSRTVTASNVDDLYLKQNPRSSPKWLAFLEDTLSETPKLSNQSNGALASSGLVIRAYALRHVSVDRQTSFNALIIEALEGWWATLPKRKKYPASRRTTT